METVSVFLEFNLLNQIGHSVFEYSHFLYGWRCSSRIKSVGFFLSRFFFWVQVNVGFPSHVSDQLLSFLYKSFDVGFLVRARDVLCRVVERKFIHCRRLFRESALRPINNGGANHYAGFNLRSSWSAQFSQRAVIKTLAMVGFLASLLYRTVS